MVLKEHMRLTKEELYGAAERCEFVPYFQPLVELRSGQIEGFEVLARWIHPQRGLVPPNDFIPHIERLGLMNELTCCLLNKTFAVARTIPERIGFSVNVSPAQLHDRKLPGIIAEMAAKASFDLRRLTAELTESALVNDLKLAGEVATDLKALGIKLALDDFGTGYSSLLHLQALPFDELKVDASFVRTMTSSRQSRKITSAVVSLGQSLGLRTIAEGVEETPQAELLLWHGCNLAQGWLYERPVPAERLAEVLARQLPTIDPSVAATPGISEAADAVDTRPMDRVSQLRAIYDGAPVGLSFVDRELRYVNLNRRLAQMAGMPIEAFLGRKIQDVVPGVFAQAEEYLKAALAGEASPGVEVRYGPATLLISFQPARDEAGEVTGVSMSVVDISVMKQAQEALRESEDHFRNTVELNPQIPWVADPEGRNLMVSSRWEALTGMGREQALGYGWLNALHPDDLAHTKEEWKKAFRAKDALDVEFRVRGVEGEWHWMRSRGAPRYGLEGKIIRWYGSVECIDDYKRALDKLRQSEARLRTIINAVPVGIVMAESPSGKVISANPRAEAILGQRLLPGTTWAEVMRGVHDREGTPLPPEKMPLLRAVRGGERTECIEVRYQRELRPSLWLSLSAAPIKENGVLLGGVVAVQVIEEPKRDAPRLVDMKRDAPPLPAQAPALLPSAPAGKRSASVVPARQSKESGRRNVA